MSKPNHTINVSRDNLQAGLKAAFENFVPMQGFVVPKEPVAEAATPEPVSLNRQNVFKDACKIGSAPSISIATSGECGTDIGLCVPFAGIGAGFSLSSDDIICLPARQKISPPKCNR